MMMSEHFECPVCKSTRFRSSQTKEGNYVRYCKGAIFEFDIHEGWKHRGCNYTWSDSEDWKHEIMVFRKTKKEDQEKFKKLVDFYVKGEL